VVSPPIPAPTMTTFITHPIHVARESRDAISINTREARSGSRHRQRHERH
jgi:hypothetical protein